MADKAGVPSGADNDSPLTQAVAGLKRHLKVLLGFSCFLNLLILTGPLYMLQVYDRVLVSRNEPTLIYLTLLAVAALLVLAALDVVRSRILVRLSNNFSQTVTPELFRLILGRARTANGLRDLETVRNFLTGSSMVTLFDVPWAPLFLAFVYLLHPYLGHVALTGAILLFGLAVWNERRTRGLLAKAGEHQRKATDFTELSARNSEAINAMGMLDNLQQRWSGDQRAALAFQAIASDRAGTLVSAAKFVRFTLQVAILGAGAWLAIQDIISPGAMIAASIVMSRALAPVESSISSWQGLQGAKRAYVRLQEAFEDYKAGSPMPLPEPKGQISFVNVYARAPAAEMPIIKAVSFAIDEGDSIGITGPSGAGKSSLVKLMTGIWFPEAGSVRLDGAEFRNWDRTQLGRYIGYLPQDIELFPGTVADNIARFGDADPEKVVAAAQLVGAHTMILDLPEAYDTVIGPGGANLSGGQRQRIGLARALYDLPKLIVLDEPTSNLDAEGESAVRTLIGWLKKQKVTCVVIAHKPAVIGGVDKLMVIQKGTLSQFGPLDEVLPGITRQVPAEKTTVPASGVAGSGIHGSNVEARIPVKSGRVKLTAADTRASANVNQGKQ
ncbi:MAG: type I secretion system permease/ATPase [Marinobacter sp.]